MRRHLQAGALLEAEALLDSYELQFPGGVVGPQVSALRRELELRQRERPPAPRAGTR